MSGSSRTAPSTRTLAARASQKSGAKNPAKGAHVATSSPIRPGEPDATGSATTNVIVKHVNVAPTANAGADQTVNEGASITLSGSGTDSDGTIASYTWTQTVGPAVTLAGANSPTASFTAPSVATDTVLTFKLTVTDDKGATGNQHVGRADDCLERRLTGAVAIIE